ncbi:MAG: tRNA (adenosine(37)-N6)-threonylcarbamoyltransferase complex transferase subunit TsaD [Acidimicrobiia bacterium]|nr:tRNA (adenosine(37)-N6)-threonylcarbamoyltransferase complex transferase subunit TsaD [Acidimicrobiia bacterium]
MTGRCVLAIETSCDETSVAVVRGSADGFGDLEVLANVVLSQVATHAPFGGVVPEVASRAHLDMLEAVVGEALAVAGLQTGDGAPVDAVAATCGPGLIGALLVGVSSAKALALAWDVPYVEVNHLEGHLFAVFLEQPDIALPMVVLLVSGGHTMLVSVSAPGRYRILGATVDDAAGEAFDKVARYLGLGYPGGPVIDRLSADGDRDAIRFPRGMIDEGLDFSFSGMKTAVINYVRRHPDAGNADLAAGFQEAVVDVLVTKALRAAARTGAQSVALGGGVAANSRLRERFAAAASDAGLTSHVPDRVLCTDNAAMIAAAAHWRLGQHGPTPLDGGAHPNLRLVDT